MTVYCVYGDKCKLQCLINITTNRGVWTSTTTTQLTQLLMTNSPDTRTLRTHGLNLSQNWLNKLVLTTHPFNGPLSGTTRVNQYQKGETNLDFTEARDSEWQWHQLGHMQVCTSLQTSNPPLSFFTGRIPFLPPNQQCQSTEVLTRSF